MILFLICTLKLFICYSFQALSAQKFREQQEGERRRHLEEMRSREADKLTAVFERRMAIETATAERKEAMLKRAQAGLVYFA